MRLDAGVFQDGTPMYAHTILYHHTGTYSHVWTYTTVLPYLGCGVLFEQRKERNLNLKVWIIIKVLRIFGLVSDAEIMCLLLNLQDDLNPTNLMKPQTTM